MILNKKNKDKLGNVLNIFLALPAIALIAFPIVVVTEQGLRTTREDREQRLKEIQELY